MRRIADDSLRFQVHKVDDSRLGDKPARIAVTVHPNRHVSEATTSVRLFLFGELFAAFGAADSFALDGVATLFGAVVANRFRVRLLPDIGPQ